MLLSKFLFLLRVFYILFEKLTNNFMQIFQNYFEKNFLILLYLLYFNVNIFVYFIQNLSRPYKKFIFIFSKLKNFQHVFHCELILTIQVVILIIIIKTRKKSCNHISKLQIVLSKMVISAHLTRQKGCISIIIIEIHLFCLRNWDTSNLLWFLGKYWDMSFLFTTFGNTVWSFMSFSLNITLESYCNIPVVPLSNFL